MTSAVDWALKANYLTVITDYVSVCAAAVHRAVRRARHHPPRVLAVHVSLPGLQVRQGAAVGAVVMTVILFVLVVLRVFPTPSSRFSCSIDRSGSAESVFLYHPP